jgi:hypothetical protein
MPGSIQAAARLGEMLRVVRKAMWNLAGATPQDRKLIVMFAVAERELMDLQELNLSHPGWTPVWPGGLLVAVYELAKGWAW